MAMAVFGAVPAKGVPCIALSLYTMIIIKLFVISYEKNDNFNYSFINKHSYIQAGENENTKKTILIFI